MWQWTSVTAAVIYMLVWTQLATAQTTQPATDNRPTIWIIGDSTVRVGTPKQQGWGDPFTQLVQSDKVRVVNKAIGGRSSRTFRTEGRWKEITDQLKPGDVVLMQFGHNDSIAPDNPDRPRGTLRGIGTETQDIIHPQTKKPETVYTYGWYMRQYVIEAKAKGATPVMVSLIPRCPRPADDKVFSPPASFPTDGYAAWAIEVAQQEGAPFIDLNQLVLKSYAGLTSKQIKEKYFTDSESDFTHTGPGGAQHNAEVVLKALRDLNQPSINALLPESK